VQKLLAFVVLFSAATRAQPATIGLSESVRLGAVYDTILQARFAQSRAEIARTCPPAPPESCLALTTAAIWWEIQLDPNNRRLDRRLQDAAAAAIDAADRWTRREPQRAEAWFYLAGAHAPLEEWRILRGMRLAAARDARGLKDALDRTVSLDPMLNDAYFGVGLYHYYAAVAPATVKVLRWLLLMPGGNREEGLREMQRARDRGALLRGEADYQLHWLYLWYEHQPARALELLRGLDQRYPSNPLFLQRIAEVERDDVHDQAASMSAWQTLLDRATRGRVEFAAMSAVRARIGLAQELVTISQARRAIDLLAPLIDHPPSTPYGADALVHFARGRAYEGLDDRERAAIEWRRAIAIAPSDDPDNIRSRARTAIARVRR
jgi:tetratricopeptide (TPR) repeat protein